MNKENILMKIKSFFSRILKKTPQIEPPKTSVKQSEDSFWKNIKVEEEQEDENILEIQRKLRNGELKVEELSEDEKQRLTDLYNRQIERITRKTEEVIAETEVINMKIARMKKLLSEN